MGDLQSALGLDSSGTSQHLGVLRKQGILEARRAGTSVFYRVKDPRMFQLLEVAREIIGSSLSEAHEMLLELTSVGRGTPPTGEPGRGRTPS